MRRFWLAPLTWIILLIIAVIAAIYAACAAVAKFTGVANSGFGVICGGIMVVIAFFKNLGLSVANIALGIWNALGGLCFQHRNGLPQCHFQCSGLVL